MKVEKLLKIAKRKAERKSSADIAAVFQQMTLEQLKELAEGTPSEDRVREILEAVGGLFLLESG